MDKVNIEVFRFEAGVDYLPYYNKCTFSFTQEQTLIDTLISLQNELDNYGYDEKYLALRINGIAIFENLPIIELVQRFGREWQIEPLSIYYATKDLLLNKEALWKRYEGFFQWADFLNIDEKNELGKYLMLNLITPMSDEHYLGDGFFLYLKWLISRHPEKIREIMQWLIEPRKGILNFVSLADMVYPRATALDEEMWDFIRDVVLSYDSRQWQLLATLKPQRKG